MPSKPKLAVFLSRFPYPLEKGDKLRAFYQLRDLSNHYEIHLFCTTEQKPRTEHLELIAAFCKDINYYQLSKLGILWNVVIALLTGKPLQVGYFFQRNIARKMEAKLNALQPDIIYAQLIRTTEYCKMWHSCPKLLDYMDALSKGMERRAEITTGLLRMIYAEESKRLARYERKVFDYFEQHTIISEQDRSLIVHPKQKHIATLANGIAPHFFGNRKEGQRHQLLFTGNMSYAPNVDAAIFLAKHCFPELKKRFPNATLVLCGADPAKEVRALQSDGVQVTGWVEDIVPYYANATVFVAPMFLGSGLQNKLLEAMAMGLPCITSPLANAALNAIPNQELLVAQTKEEFLEGIYFLIEHPEAASEIAQSGKRFVQQHYNWGQLNEQLRDILFSLLPSEKKQ